MLTARSDDIDVVAGLEVGADDYIVKPVSPRVLDARIKANLRRTTTPHPDGAAPSADETVEKTERFGDLIIDRPGVRVCRGETELDLSPTEVRLMFAFTRHVGQVLSRDQLLELVWGQSHLGDSRLVDNAVQRLRVKIDPPGGAGPIETVRGFGYRFVA